MFSLVFLQEKVDEVHARITLFKELERFKFCKYVLLGKYPAWWPVSPSLLQKWPVWPCYLLSLSKENNKAFNFSHGTALTRVMYSFPFNLVQILLQMSNQTEAVFCVCMCSKGCLHMLFRRNNLHRPKLFNQTYFFFFNGNYVKNCSWRLSRGGIGGDFVQGCNRASADAAVSAEPSHGNGMYAWRRKFLVSVALLLSQATWTDLAKTFFCWHVRQGCCSHNYLARVCDFLHVIQPDTTISCWLNADWSDVGQEHA